MNITLSAIWDIFNKQTDKEWITRFFHACYVLLSYNANYYTLTGRVHESAFPVGCPGGIWTISPGVPIASDLPGEGTNVSTGTPSQ